MVIGTSGVKLVRDDVVGLTIPTMVSLPDGGWLTLWSSHDTLWGYGVFQQRFSADGTPKGSLTQVTPDTRNQSGNTENVVVLSDGGWVVTWTAQQSGNPLLQKVYNADGSARGGVRQITDNSGYSPAEYAELTALKNGGWVVAWSMYDSAGGATQGIYQRAFSKDGNASTDIIKVSDVGGRDAFTSDITTLNDGGWLVTWTDYNEIYQSSFDAGGNRRGETNRVNTFAEGEQSNAKVSLLSNGGWVVTWMSAHQDGYDYGIYQQAFNANGSRNGTEKRVNTFYDSTQTTQEVVSLKDGGWVVIWRSNDQAYPGYDIYQQAFNADGSRRGGETRVNKDMPGEQNNHMITALSDGGWVVTWHIGDGDYSSFQQAFNADGTRNGREIKIGDGVSVQKVLALPDGSWVVSWNTYGGLTSNGWITDSYQQRFRANDNPVAHNHTASVLENGRTSIDVLSSATDPNGDNLKVSAAGVISGFGAASVDKNGKIVFDPQSTQVPEGETRKVVIAYTVSDAFGGKTTAQISITVSGINNAPVISSNGGGASATVKLAENKTAVSNVKAADPDGNAVTYTISGGADKALFKIDAKTGALSFIKARDFEVTTDKNKDNIYEVTVRATDGKLTDTQTIKVKLTDVKGEVLAGTSKADKLNGGLGSDTLDGKGGADTLTGGMGNDILKGGDGNDKLLGGAGADKLYGGSGSDSASYEGATKAVGASLWNRAFNTGDAKGDVYSSIENLIGSSYNDRLEGNTASNIIKGGAGNDRIYGGSGADRLYGGSGADSFIFKKISESTISTRDMIYDFSRAGGDKINLTAIDASTKISGNQAFVFIGEKDFSKKAGELRYFHKSGDTFVYGDVDGDGKADFSVRLDKSIDLVKDDFIL